MKARESGMPPEETWDEFFDPAEALDRLRLTPRHRDVVDIGCGYGTFAVPAAMRVGGTVHAIDIDPAMVERTRKRASAAGLDNVRCDVRDFVDQGTGLSVASIDYATLFNLLHLEDPEALLAEVFRVLNPGGRLAVMHWRHNPMTPRGPSLAIRPRPQSCVEWATRCGFRVEHPIPIELPPYHFGLTFLR